MATIRQGSAWIRTRSDTGQEERHHVTSATGTEVITWNEETGARNGPGAVAWHGSPADFLANFKPSPHGTAPGA
jgi:hypothetical protein